MSILNQLGKHVNSHVNKAGGTTGMIKCTGKGGGEEKQCLQLKGQRSD